MIDQATLPKSTGRTEAETRAAYSMRMRAADTVMNFYRSGIAPEHLRDAILSLPLFVEGK